MRKRIFFTLHWRIAGSVPAVDLKFRCHIHSVSQRSRQARICLPSRSPSLPTANASMLPTHRSTRLLCSMSNMMNIHRIWQKLYRPLRFHPYRVVSQRARYRRQRPPHRYSQRRRQRPQQHAGQTEGRAQKKRASLYSNPDRRIHPAPEPRRHRQESRRLHATGRERQSAPLRRRKVHIRWRNESHPPRDLRAQRKSHLRSDLRRPAGWRWRSLADHVRQRHHAQPAQAGVAVRSARQFLRQRRSFRRRPSLVNRRHHQRLQRENLAHRLSQPGTHR